MGASRSSRSATAPVAPSSTGAPPRARRQGPAVTLDPEQRSRLLAAKLGALVADATGASDGGEVAHGVGDRPMVPGTFPGGAAARRGDEGWVLVGERPESALGRALVWADREGVAKVHLFVDDAGAAGLLARRATAFEPQPEVWLVEGRRTRRAQPAPLPVPIEPPPSAREQIGLLEGAGVEVVTEHGEIRGEVLGLEVARVVVDEVPESGVEAARVEVGVGRHDRDAFTMLHGGVPTAEALAGVVEKVRHHRQADAEAHPLGRLAAERWLRALLVAEPAAVGAARLVPADPTIPREGVKDVAPAIAFGVDDAGRAVVVACSVGIDLDLVPAAADARLAHAPEARLVVVVPERDDHPVTRRLVSALAKPAEVVVVPADWRRAELGGVG